MSQPPGSFEMRVIASGQSTKPIPATSGPAAASKLPPTFIQFDDTGQKTSGNSLSNVSDAAHASSSRRLPSEPARRQAVPSNVHGGARTYASHTLSSDTRSKQAKENLLGIPSKAPPKAQFSGKSTSSFHVHYI